MARSFVYLCAPLCPAAPLLRPRFLIFLLHRAEITHAVVVGLEDAAFNGASSNPRARHRSWGHVCRGGCIRFTKLSNPPFVFTAPVGEIKLRLKTFNHAN